MALSTINSSLKRIWQKFFLLLRIATISPHWSNTSRIISSHAFSGSPPTNTVLQPGGRSLVDGGGRSTGYTKSKSQLNNDCISPTFFFQPTFLQGKMRLANALVCMMHMKHLLGFWGKSVQLLQWIISLMTGSSGCTGGGGTRLIPAIMGLMGAIMPKLGSKPWIQIESGIKKKKSNKIKK